MEVHSNSSSITLSNETNCNKCGCIWKKLHLRTLRYYNTLALRTCVHRSGRLTKSYRSDGVLKQEAACVFLDTAWLVSVVEAVMSDTTKCTVTLEELSKRLVVRLPPSMRSLQSDRR